ncbi:MAG TPA: 4-hydroxy-tetrahydrodipicolinate synthase [Longimicrobiaceae bacterium]|nr:4-hydroxy-tetrahydrodipicolinate synthase [Longimicrobiaceae bacterium]
MADGARPERLLFTGSGVALVTPFRAAGVNEAVLRELVRFHLREGTDALVVNGSTGEATTMSPEEQRRTAEVVVDEAGRRVPVVVGCGGSDTAAVCRLAEGARAAGADAVLVSPPPYNKPPQRGIIAHYLRVMDAGGLPCIVYNVPGRTACNILPETVEALADQDERVVGVKEASGDISQVAELARRVAGRVAVYSGNDDQVVPLMALGGMGVISVLANVAPAATSRMAHAYLEGDVAASRRLQLDYLPLIAALFREPNPIPVKAAVAMLGFDVGPLRLPLVEASDAVLRELREAMAALGIGGAS